MAAKAYYNDMNGKDPLYRHHSNLTKHFKIRVPKKLVEAATSGKSFIVPDRIRFRKESGYYTINVRWANAFEIPEELALFLIEKQARKENFSIHDMPTEDPVSDLIYLIYKDGVRSSKGQLNAEFDKMTKFGASVNPWDMPKGLIEAV